MTQISGSTVLVTGAAAGIGMLLCKRLAGMDVSTLVLWDKNALKLDELGEELRSQNIGVHIEAVDLRDKDMVKEAAERTFAAVGVPDIIVNNAGIIIGKEFQDHQVEDIETTMDVNALAPMHVVHSFIQMILNKGKCHIVNVASAAGLLGNPKMSVYVASKWALVGWSESLRLELEQKGRAYRVTTVTPYYIDTGMFSGVRSPVLPVLRPQTVVDAIIHGISKNKIVVRVPRLLHLVPLLKGIMPPRMFDLVVGKGFGVYKSMEEFRGHGQ